MAIVLDHFQQGFSYAYIFLDTVEGVNQGSLKYRPQSFILEVYKAPVNIEGRFRDWWARQKSIFREQEL